MAMSQRLFARVLHASPEAVKAWGQGRQEPEGMVLALLDVAERHSEALLEGVEKIDKANEGLAANT